MIPTLLITLREVVEASLIVATILGILVKENQKKQMRMVWSASISALITSFILVFTGSFIGIHIGNILENPQVEGLLSILSALCITTAVFFIHSHFAHKKAQFLSHIRDSIASDGIFAFTFLAVFREGIEITLFLSSLYITNSSLAIVSGFSIGILLGIGISVLFFRTTLKMPIFWAFRVTSFLLIIFAGGLLARGLGEFLEIYPATLLPTLTIAFLPDQSTVIGGAIETVFGITRSMYALQLIPYSLYIYFMHQRIFVHPIDKTY